MSDQTSYREIVRSTVISGLALTANLATSVVRTKVAALILGPAGVGLIGIYGNLITVVSTIAALGMGNAGTRQIAQLNSKTDTRLVSDVRAALVWGLGILGVLGGVGFWLTRDEIRTLLAIEHASSSQIGWLAVGVAFTVASGAQTAVLNGQRRIKELAAVSAIAAICSTLVAIAMLLLFGEGGIVAFVLAGPIAVFFLGHIYTIRDRLSRPQSRAVIGAAKLARGGVPLMIAALALPLGVLAVRAILQSELGQAASGHFHAAWVISSLYVGLVLNSMSADYFPRLSAAIHDHKTANRLVNEQTEIALLVIAPAFLLLMGCASFVVRILYSSEFSEAVFVLRWQLLGDALKVVSWPLGFILLASGDGKKLIYTEYAAVSAFIALSWIGVIVVGIQGVGGAFLGMYLAYTPLIYWVGRKKTGFAWSQSVKSALAVIISWLLLILAASYFSNWLAASLGIASAAVVGLLNLRKLDSLIELPGVLHNIAQFRIANIH